MKPNYILNESCAFFYKDATTRDKIFEKLNIKKIKKLPLPKHEIAYDPSCNTNAQKMGQAMDIFFQKFTYALNRDVILNQYSTHTPEQVAISADHSSAHYLKYNLNRNIKKITTNDIAIAILSSANWQLPHADLYNRFKFCHEERDYARLYSDLSFYFACKEGRAHLFKRKRLKKLGRYRVFKLQSRFDEEFEKANQRDIAHIKSLIALVPTSSFIAKKRCHTQRLHVYMGCVPDMIIDDTLFEIKTVDQYKLKKDYLVQLMIYVLLFNVGGMYPNDKNKKPIKNIAIYFARQGVLWKQSIDSLISKEDMEVFTEWFKKEYMQKVDNIKEV